MPSRSVLVSILLLCAARQPLAAQTGVVKSGGQPIPGATVTAKSAAGEAGAVTNANGGYELPPVPAGAGTIEVRMFGFDTATRQVTFGPALKTADFNLQLQQTPAGRRQAQFAGARAGAADPADTATSDNANRSDVPAPPAQAAASPSTSENSNEAFLVSGSLSQGLAPNAPPDVGDLQQRGRFPGSDAGPGFGGGGFPGGGPAGAGGGGRGFGGPGGGGFGGRAAGGRPGGAARQFGNRRQANSIRGMLFATLDNSALNARPFSISGLNARQPAYAHLRYGVVAGGPLVFPKLPLLKLINDPATFFSFSYFGTRARNPYSAFATVPSALEREGDFSRSLQSAGPVRIFDPRTRQPFAGNAIPRTRIDPIAAQLLGFIPPPNSPGTVNNYAYYASVAQNADNLSLRFQRNLTKADRASFRVNIQRRDGANSQPFAFLDQTNGFGLNAALQWTRNITPRAIANAEATFNRNRAETRPFFARGPNVAAALGIAGTSADPLNYGPPNLNFTNFGALGDASPVLTRNQSQGLSARLIWIRGQHTFTFGAEYRRADLSARTDQNGRGTFNFTGLATSALDAQGRPLPGSGFDLADFLLGLPQSSSIRYGDTNTYFAQNIWTGFVLDDWKIHPRLTLNLGVRYEYFSPLSEKYGRIANLDIAPGYTAVAVVTPGSTGPYSGRFARGLIDSDFNNVSPRLGLAWKAPHMKRSTIVRAGYGIYYNGQSYNAFAGRLAGQPPFAISNSVNTSPQDLLTLAGGFVATSPADVTNTYAVDRRYRTPYAQTWNLSVQHELPRGFFVELGYLGTKGTRLDVLTLPNEGPPGAAAQKRNQTGNATGFTFDSSVGNSIYHALQTRATQRFRRGISMSAFYTFSKSIDDSSSFGGAGNTVAQNWLNLRAERGLSSFDRRHSFDANWVWTSQAGAPGSRLATAKTAARLLKDWQVNGGLTAQSGTPLTARVLGNTARLAQTGGIGSGRADATGIDLASSGFFNLAAFTAPAPGEFGNAGRNTIPGPRLVSLNLGFGRSFQFDESRRRLELRIEANNALNHVNYTNFNTVVNSIDYGIPVSAGSMRSVNINLRFRF